MALSEAVAGWAGTTGSVLGCAIIVVNATASAGVTAVRVPVTAQPATNTDAMNLRGRKAMVGDVVPT
jgi:hypothetical protein